MPHFGSGIHFSRIVLFLPTYSRNISSSVKNAVMQNMTAYNTGELATVKINILYHPDLYRHCQIAVRIL